MTVSPRCNPGFAAKTFYKFLPALSVRHRLLVLPCDEGGSPHRTAVAVSEPAHRGRRRKLTRDPDLKQVEHTEVLKHSTDFLLGSARSPAGPVPAGWLGLIWTRLPVISTRRSG